jgi:hypothetical protein
MSSLRWPVGSFVPAILSERKATVCAPQRESGSKTTNPILVLQSISARSTLFKHQVHAMPF